MGRFDDEGYQTCKYQKCEKILSPDQYGLSFNKTGFVLCKKHIKMVKFMKEYKEYHEK